MAEKRRKYRLAMLDDLTLREVFHFRVSMLGAITMITLSFLLLIVLLSVLIVYTKYPARLQRESAGTVDP